MSLVGRAGRAAGGAASGLLAPMAWTAYVAAPVAAWPWLNGIPLDPLEAGVIALVWWVWAARRQIPGAIVLVALAALKLAAGAALVPGGFAARYYANDAWSPPVERSVAFRRDDVTQIDRRLAFGGPGQPDLPLHFLNDVRFNFYGRGQPQRHQLPYSVVWSGWFEHRSDDGVRTFYLSTSEQIEGELAVDGRPVIPATRAADRSGAIALSRGWHEITVRVAASQGAGRRAEAGELVLGERRPFDADVVYLAPAGALRVSVDYVGRWMARAIDVAVLGWLAALTVRGARRAWQAWRPGRLLWLAVVADALLFALPFAGRAVVLGGGDDWLTYEHLARAIVADPLLQEPGPAPGQGTPFYYQALYPYFVALTHLVFGDELFGAVFVQRLLLGAAAGWIFLATRRLFGPTTGWVAAAIGGLVLYAKGGPWADVLLGESLFTPLLAWWVWLLVRTGTGGATPASAVLVAVAGGIATLVRVTLLPALLVVVPMWSRALRAKRMRATGIVAAVMVLILLLPALRSWVVTGRAAVIPESGAVTFALDNRPRQPLTAPSPMRSTLYDLLHVPPGIAGFIEYALQRPGELGARLGHKALYAVGLFKLSGLRPFGAIVPDVSWVYVLTWCGALAGAGRLLAAGRPAPGWPSALIALPGVVALAHFALMVLFAPQIHGDRRILPMYPLLVPYAAFALLPLVERARSRLPVTACAILTGLAAAVFISGSPRLDELVVLLVLAGGAVAIAGDAPPRLSMRGWLYVGYAVVAIAAYAAGRRLGGVTLDPRSVFLLPLAVFAVSRLARPRAAIRAALGAAAAAATVTVLTADLVIPAALYDWSDDLGAARSSFANVVAGRPGAATELAGDLQSAWASFPARDSAAAIAEHVGAGAACLLFAMWIQATIVAGRAALRRRSLDAAVCCAALAVAWLAMLAGAAPADWGDAPYSLAVLALLLGLAESRASEDAVVAVPAAEAAAGGRA